MSNQITEDQVNKILKSKKLFSVISNRLSNKTFYYHYTDRIEDGYIKYVSNIYSSKFKSYKYDSEDCTIVLEFTSSIYKLPITHFPTLLNSIEVVDIIVNDVKHSSESRYAYSEFLIKVKTGNNDYAYLPLVLANIYAEPK